MPSSPRNTKTISRCSVIQRSTGQTVTQKVSQSKHCFTTCSNARLRFQVRTNFQTSTPKSSVSKIWAWTSMTPEPLWVATTGISIALPSKSLARPSTSRYIFVTSPLLSFDKLSSSKIFVLASEDNFFELRSSSQKACYLVFSSRLKSICQ